MGVAWLGKDNRMKKLGMLLVMLGLGGIFGCADTTAPKAPDAKAAPAAGAPAAPATKPADTKPADTKAPPAAPAPAGK